MYHSIYLHRGWLSPMGGRSRICTNWKFHFWLSSLVVPSGLSILNAYFRLSLKHVFLGMSHSFGQPKLMGHWKSLFRGEVIWMNHPSTHVRWWYWSSIGGKVRNLISLGGLNPKYFTLIKGSTSLVGLGRPSRVGYQFAIILTVILYNHSGF